MDIGTENKGCVDEKMKCYSKHGIGQKRRMSAPQNNDFMQQAAKLAGADKKKGMTKKGSRKCATIAIVIATTDIVKAITINSIFAMVMKQKKLI